MKAWREAWDIDICKKCAGNTRMITRHCFIALNDNFFSEISAGLALRAFGKVPKAKIAEPRVYLLSANQLERSKLMPAASAISPH